MTICETPVQTIKCACKAYTWNITQDFLHVKYQYYYTMHILQYMNKNQKNSQSVTDGLV